MKLNLTDKQRQGVKVTFNVNKFEAHLESGALLGKYSSKSALKKEFKENGIKANFYGQAQQKYLRGYGDGLER